ncbi:unnamed protein product [Dibothriocephalus latus]|uniref:Concentrative nucleoside transporter N-terminal domain-containing protein n=1 Tax=Dibothriocephalus latus TaxID=60516 RepID=A0A3P7MS84_DIBLA|nr:unnamed protein product [Dibothriocephalus latus]
MTEWTGVDFPRTHPNEPKGINIVFQAYANFRRKIFGNKNSLNKEHNEGDAEEEEDYDSQYYVVNNESVCCDSRAGLCGLILLLLIDVAYVAYSCACNGLATENDIRLLWLSVLVWGWHGFLHLCRKRWDTCWDRANCTEKDVKEKKHLVLNWVAISLMLAFVILCLVFFVILEDVRNLVSLSGIVLLILISILMSWHPGKINWHPPLVGIFVQFLFAVLTLRTRPGFVAFQWLGDRMSEFLENSKAGSEFVFADYHCFAFDVESPLITRPYMHMMTNSELHAIMVNGFASVAGAVLAAYIGFGVSPPIITLP